MGYDNGDLKILDLKTNKLIFEKNLKSGIVCIEFDRKDIPMNKLLVTTLESRFRVFDLRTLHPEEGFADLTVSAHKSTVWTGRHLPDNREIFMTTGGNGTANLYKYTYPSQRVVKDSDGKEKGVVGKVDLLAERKMGELPVAAFDWSRDKPGLCALACLDQNIKVAIVTKLHKQ